jgi:hypothetical protein
LMADVSVSAGDEGAVRGEVVGLVPGMISWGW